MCLFYYKAVISDALKVVSKVMRRHKSIRSGELEMLIMVKPGSPISDFFNRVPELVEGRKNSEFFGRLIAQRRGRPKERVSLVPFDKLRDPLKTSQSDFQPLALQPLAFSFKPLAFQPSPFNNYI
jgi:hypothetical protein